MTDVHQCTKVDFLSVSLCFQDNLLLAFDFLQLPCWKRSSFFGGWRTQQEEAGRWPWSPAVRGGSLKTFSKVHIWMKKRRDKTTKQQNLWDDARSSCNCKKKRRNQNCRLWLGDAWVLSESTPHVPFAHLDLRGMLRA